MVIIADCLQQTNSHDNLLFNKQPTNKQQTTHKQPTNNQQPTNNYDKLVSNKQQPVVTTTMVIFYNIQQLRQPVV